MAEGAQGPQQSKIIVLGLNGRHDFQENLGIGCLFRKIGYVSQDHVEDKTMVWLHSSEGTGKGEQCGEGSVEEGGVFAVGAFQMNRSLSGRELQA